jgi:type IV fimbrial biogenesis protein FimT
MKTAHTGRIKHPAVRAAGLRGFTLIELMVTVAVAAILLAVGVPALNDALLGSKLTGHANEMVGSALLARGEAIKRNAVVSLCASADGSSCAASGSWEQGWIVACKTSDHASCDAAGADWLIFRRFAALPSGFKMIESSGQLKLDFQPSGVGTTQASFTACRDSPSVGAQERVVRISATGGAAVTRSANGACS